MTIEEQLDILSGEVSRLKLFQDLAIKHAEAVKELIKDLGIATEALKDIAEAPYQPAKVTAEDALNKLTYKNDS